MDEVEVITFEGIAPPGEWVGDQFPRPIQLSGVRDFMGDPINGQMSGPQYPSPLKISNCVFSAHRCLCVMDRENHERYDWDAPAILEVSTRIRPHNSGPGGPLRAQPPMGTFAVGAEMLTILPEAQPVLVRLLVNGDHEEYVVQTHERPKRTFFGVVSEDEIGYVEFDVPPRGTNHYLFISDFAHGVPK